MARSKPSRGSRRPHAGGEPRRPAARRGGFGVLRALALSALILAFGAGIFAARAVLRLDRLVQQRFAGRLFQVPSRVYSAPTILYAGLDLDRADLRGVLRRLGYREVAPKAVDTPGSYAWETARVLLYVRAFEHPTRPEPARRIELRLIGSQLDSVRDAESSHELAAVMLEPELVGAYYGPDHEQRELVRLGEVPRHLVDAVLAVEDQRFQEHHGIDPVRILGAMWANLRAGGIAQGGSTVTEQLVKNFFLTPERTLGRRLKTAVMSLIVEARYSKDEILECYLNEIYLGQRGSTAIHGVGEAAHFYFGKTVRDLRVEDSALLAGLIHSPGGDSPYADPERARVRRDLVLQLMLAQGRIDQASYDTARAQPLALSPRTNEPRETRYFLDAVRRQLPEVYDREVLSSQGLRIYSTLDLHLQQRAALALDEGLDALEKQLPGLRVEGGPRLEGCLLALRPQTGEVLALVGGRDYGQTQFDRCTQAKRPAGSSFKPFVYIAALEAAGSSPVITLASHLDDSPLSIHTPSGDWSPVNYDHKFHGIVSVRSAIEHSMNVATARLGQEVGIDRVADVAHRLGIESDLELVPSLALGAADLTPLELARAYASIANGGVRPEVRFFEDLVDPAGHVLERRSVAFERVLDPGTAYLAVSLLEGVVDRGTGSAIRKAGLRGPVAGKTGTTNDSKDAWFVGFTPDLVAVVWVGFDDPRGMRYPAARLAVPIWERFVRDVTGGQVRGSFVPPPGVHTLDVDPATGAVALDGCPRRQPEYFADGTEPRATCPETTEPVLAGGSGGATRGESRGASPGAPGWLGRIVERLFGGPE